MTIKGLTLPQPFLIGLERGMFQREMGSWPLIESVDAYGHPLETELGEVYDTAEKIERESARLPDDFPAELDGEPDMFASVPGFIPYITDFDRILAFAIAGDGSPFCFDYRESSEPSVIWWADAYWHRVAPSFTAFFSLFDFERKL